MTMSTAGLHNAKLRVLCGGLLLGLCCTPLRAQLPPTGTLQPDAAVNSLLQQLCQQHELPGMIAARIEGDQVVRIGAAGIRKAGADERLKIHDQIHLGSCTKALTATMLGCLVEEGRIDWATTVGECLPEWRQEMHPGYQSVTLRQLLTHRAGLPAEDGRIFRTNREISPTQQRRVLFRQLLAEPPRDEPGSRFQYSNLGYMLAGLMAEAVTGESWEHLMQQRLFTPLQMRSAGFGAPGTPGQTDQPWGHRAGTAAGWIAEQADNPAVLGPAGTVHCSVADWARFLALHLGHAPDPPLLDGGTLLALHTPQPGEDYALGWAVCQRDWAQGAALTHAGSNTMWFAVVWLAPARDLAVLAATNSGQSGAEEACDKAVSALLQISSDPQNASR